MQSEVATLVEAWHWMYFETDLMFDDLHPVNLHRRPTPKLLSVSEHCAHLVRSEASIVNRYLFGQPEAEWADTPMRKRLFGWPPTMLESPVDPDLAAMSVAEVKGALLDEHRRCYELAQKLELPAHHVFEDDWDRCRIAAYHVGYHMGQIYTARHLLGEETPEN